MNDTQRNTRTLITCFAIAIFALIPLRFYEVLQVEPTPAVPVQNHVLGTSSEIQVKPTDTPTITLEAPYEELEKQSPASSSCISPQEANPIIENLQSLLESPNLSAANRSIILAKIKEIKAGLCP